MRNPFSRNQIGLLLMQLSQGNNGSMSKIPAIINKQTNKDLPTTLLLQQEPCHLCLIVWWLGVVNRVMPPCSNLRASEQKNRKFARCVQSRFLRQEDYSWLFIRLDTRSITGSLGEEGRPDSRTVGNVTVEEQSGWGKEWVTSQVMQETLRSRKRYGDGCLPRDPG